MSEVEKEAEIRRIVREKLSGETGCHDFDHTLRVLANAEKLLKEYPQAEPEIVRLAALLHDIARPEEDASQGKICHAELGCSLAAEIMRQHGFPESVTKRVAEAVRSHRYRSGCLPETLEAEIVFDADKLDSLGATGLGRAFLFAGRVGARLHNTEAEALSHDAYSPEDTAYREYLVKLRHLPGRMRTAAGKKIAEDRLAYMREFFLRLETEISS